MNSNPNGLSRHTNDAMAGEVITVYVRKGANDYERRISFPRPSKIPAMEFLNRNIALDGNQVVFTIYPIFEPDTVDSIIPPEISRYGGPFVEEHNIAFTSINTALVHAEKGLAELLLQYGYSIDFA